MTLNINTLEELLKKSAVAIKPTENMRVSESAEEYRYLNNPGSYVGKWRNSFAPYLTEIMDTMGSIYHDALIFAGPARCGKSDCVFNYLTHIQKTDPSDFLLIHMTKTSARDWSLIDLRKVFRTTEALGEMVMPGRQSMNVHDVQFIGDTRLLIKWPTINEVSGKTIPRHWAMDYDRMPEDIDGEGALFPLLKKRGDTFSVSYRMTVAESSPGYSFELPEGVDEWIPESLHEAPPTRGILSLYNGGDRRRWYWRCADCNEAFEADFCHLKWDKGIKDPFKASKTTVLVCPHCEFEHTHDADLENGQPGKIGLNRAGKWLKDGEVWELDGSVTGEATVSTTASFWLKGVAAAFSTWQGLVNNYLKAKIALKKTNSDKDLKVTVNVDQGHPYKPEDTDDSLSADALFKRKKFHNKGEVPEGVRFLVATVDIQNDRFEVMVMGVGDDETIYIVDRFNIKWSEREDEEYPGQKLPINPASYAEDYHVLIPEVIEKNYPLADGSDRVMGIKMVAMDSAGKDGFTVNAYKFWKFLRDDEDKRGYHMKFQLLKGASSEDAPRFAVRYPDTERKDRKAKARGEIPVGFIGTLVQKDRAYGMLGKEEGPGRVAFCEGLGRWFYNELLSETRLEKKWENVKRVRNESFDLLTYGISIILHKRINYEKINWDNAPVWAEEWDLNELVFEVNEDGVYEMVEPEKPKKTLAALGAALG